MFVFSQKLEETKGNYHVDHPSTSPKRTGWPTRSLTRFGTFKFQNIQRSIAIPFIEQGWRDQCRPKWKILSHLVSDLIIPSQSEKDSSKKQLRFPFNPLIARHSNSLALSYPWKTTNGVTHFCSPTFLASSSIPSLTVSFQETQDWVFHLLLL